MENRHCLFSFLQSSIKIKYNCILFLLYDINEFFENYKDDITPRMQMIIESFISKMDNETYEENKKKDIKIILYNNRDKVNKEILEI